ncbi:guanylin-like protein [Amazona aestiva]|uniref:Guanylate cyclase activator 2B n=1 Tax=Amazona aestiva TaxID=12930 RepID=A0A0Q3SP35_AMAAE|nr:guanylin-like protein [Amazona aestiva]
MGLPARFAPASLPVKTTPDTFTKPRQPHRSAKSCFMEETCTISSQAVYVQDGDLKFSLESVKKLKELMDENRHINPRFVVSMASYCPCDEKDLPEEFQSVCKREDASVIFERLNLAVQEEDLCEICANVACAGCF